MYEMCVGYRPTDSGGYKYGKLLPESLGSGPIPYPKRDWKAISPAAQDAISRCLHIDPTQRITAHDLLVHPWLQGG